MKRRWMAIWMSTMLLAACATACGTPDDSGTKEPPKEEVEVDHDTPMFELNRYLVPVWDDNGVAYNETAMLIRTQDDMYVFDVQLAYPIEEVISVRDFSLDEEYVKGVDYDYQDGILKIKETGRLFDIAIAYKEYFIDRYVQGQNWPLAEGEGAQIMTEASGGNAGLTAHQIAVTYTHSAKWAGAKPQDKSAKFPKFSQKIANGEPTSIVCLGDSISYGWTASGTEEVFLRPFCPKYFDLVTRYADYKYGGVTAANYSVGGMTSAWGKENVQVGNVVSQNPDLLILAFGMNDGSGRNSMSPGAYKENIKTTIDRVRATCPDCEVVLVATMLPNKEVGFHPGDSVLGNQKNYLAALLELENTMDGVAVADVTSVHEELLKRKAFRDMSANNINHPNDYVHRVYAQVILQTLFGKIETVTIPED